MAKRTERINRGNGWEDVEIVLEEVRSSDWVKPDLWPAPFYAQKGEHRCLAYGLGAQCQRPLGHEGGHSHQGVFPNGQVLESGWGQW